MGKLGVLGLHEPLQRSSWTRAATLFPEGASNIQQLKFYGENLNTDVLALLITSCKALQHLSYSQSSNSGGNLGGSNDRCNEEQSLSIDFRVIVHALQRHRSSLRALALYHTGATDDTTTAIWASASLAGFEKLEKVCLDASVLF
jgi:hypothetical protein